MCLKPPIDCGSLHPEANTLSKSASRARLAEIIRKRSFGRGEITLASGRKSDFYFNLKPTMLDPEGASLLAELTFEALKDDNLDYVGGLEMGESLQGKRVVIVEDVTTTGGSALKAVEAVREAGGEVVLVLTMVDRDEGATDTFGQAGLPFRSLYKAGEFLKD